MYSVTKVFAEPAKLAFECFSTNQRAIGLFRHIVSTQNALREGSMRSFVLLLFGAERSNFWPFLSSLDFACLRRIVSCLTEYEEEVEERTRVTEMW